VLTGADGAFILDHEVTLDPASWQFEAFSSDLARYLDWHVIPDQRDADEARIIHELGEWIGAHVLGPVAAALVNRRPVAVLLVVPDGAQELLDRPLELGWANGRPIAVQQVTLVRNLPGAQASDVAGKAAIDGRLRVLGLFSLPDGEQALNLRRERHSLVRLVTGIAAAGRAAEVKVLQYGVTRRALDDVLTDGCGWDIIHVSGHGAPGELLLETAAGQPDPLSAADLAELLMSARDQLKLVTIVVRGPTARMVAEQCRLLGLPAPDQRSRTGEAERARGASPPSASSGALATELATRLGCAVLAMRYPVDDEFATALNQELYELLLERGQPLPRAVGTALRRLAGASDSARAFPALSAATPAVFGARAVDLRLAAPPGGGPESFSLAALKMAGFPPQPDRFVGRTAVMIAASAALAPGSEIAGVLLHGMPGGGKTACALEVAYAHEQEFLKLAWYKAPDDGMAIDGALTDFAHTLERYLPGFQMADALVTPERLSGFLPRLTELMEQYRLLIVIDNAESLLTESGQWRDDRWDQVIGAMTGHTGPGRLLLTSRRVPASVTAAGAGPRLRVEAVDALSADEALLLARELPHLKALIEGNLPGTDPEVSRRLALGVQNVAQGHPKLLELANGQAARPEQLTALIEAGDQAWREQGGLPDGFFATGETAASPGDYWNVLAAWTTSIADTLESGDRDLFWFLCCLEEADRVSDVLNGNWSGLWHRLGRAGESPALGLALAALAGEGLISIHEEAPGASESYPIHPAVAAAGRVQAGQPFQAVVDMQAATYWRTVAQSASGDLGDGTLDTGLMVRAGLASVPYLIRQREWVVAAALLEQAFNREPTRANAAAMLPAIRQAADHDPSQIDVLAVVVGVFDPAAAESLLRDYLRKAQDSRDFRAASITAGHLANLCGSEGRPDEALALIEQKAGYSRQAGLGPWTQLMDKIRRLQLLNAMGQAAAVLAEVHELRAQTGTLPTRGFDEAVRPWHVRELLFDTGRQAALKLSLHDEALELNGEVLASMRARHAPRTEWARARFNDYYPLLSFNRFDEAEEILEECRQVFTEANDSGMLGRVRAAHTQAEVARRRQRNALGSN
jgi:hypothetical protein